jgi:signal transduction histidine kinase
MAKRLKLLPLLLLLFCSGVPVRLWAQIRPPSQATVPEQVAARQPQPGATAAVVRGWSLGNELNPSRAAGDVTLSPGEPQVVLFFDVAPEPAQPIEFRYRLYGYDADWTVTTSRIAHYRRLAPGRYRFDVQAHRLGEPWPLAASSLSLEQRPFFYQTWYFYLLLVLGIVALTAQLLSQRDQLLKGQMGMVLEERNRIAADCHDSLMAGFAAISWQLEATSKLFRDAGTAETPAAKSCELARSMVAHCQGEARRIIWDLRDPEELTDVLSHALSRAVEAHRLRDRIQTQFEVHGDEIAISPGAVHHLVCIGQEAVTNAIRHSKASMVHIGLRYDSDSLSLSIRDNGQGFQRSNSTRSAGHFGIPVMEERARKLGGNLRLSSSAEVGTEVSVTVSFQSINQPANRQHHVVPWIGV